MCVPTIICISIYVCIRGTNIYTHTHTCSFFSFFLVLDNTDVLLDAKCEAITIFVVTPDDSFYFAAVVCVVENLAEGGVV